MEIQKIFSNVEDPEENLYSVLMDEEELYLFSEYQKEFAKMDKSLAKKLGKSVKEIRKVRNQDGAGAMMRKNSIHHRINQKALEGADSASANKLFPQGSSNQPLIMGPKNKKTALHGGKFEKLEYDHGWGSGFGQKMGENKSFVTDRIEAMKDVMQSRNYSKSERKKPTWTVKEESEWTTNAHFTEPMKKHYKMSRVGKDMVAGLTGMATGGLLASAKSKKGSDALVGGILGAAGGVGLAKAHRKLTGKDKKAEELINSRSKEYNKFDEKYVKRCRAGQSKSWKLLDKMSGIKDKTRKDLAEL